MEANLPMKTVSTISLPIALPLSFNRDFQINDSRHWLINMVFCCVIVLFILGSPKSAWCGEIHKAAQDGDLEKIKALLKNNPDLISAKDDRSTNFFTFTGYTPLHLAANGGH